MGYDTVERHEREKKEHIYEFGLLRGELPFQAINILIHP